MRMRKPTIKVRENSQTQYDLEKGEIVFTPSEFQETPDKPKAPPRRTSRARKPVGGDDDDYDYAGLEEDEEAARAPRRSSRSKAKPVRTAADDDEWKFSQCKTLMTKLRRHKVSTPSKPVRILFTLLFAKISMLGPSINLLILLSCSYLIISKSSRTRWILAQSGNFFFFKKNNA